ncbi:hypothetical protein [Peribacillus deserti]|uniref:Co-chaperone DjlA N-terminal domain-containing protein n=1 Tax=Peribacillus deserti TaxID=673318 RepID=A0A2N5M2Q2_9BACI|nr:hypothetical protein [Peribacillus deserti]PLT28649.1 hypothetical protein CUU66_17260 [Peribacillus deserti]
MFLAELDSEERIAFIELAALIAKIDGDLSIYESPILTKYITEMGLESYRLRGLGIENILEQFKSERSKNIVLTEIFQLIFSDGVFHDEEQESIRFIKEHFGFDSSEFESFKGWIGKIRELSISS